MANIYSFTDTWNDSGTAFTGIGLDVTDTASAAASNLLDLKVGGTSQFNVGKAGGTVTMAGNGSFGLHTFLIHPTVTMNSTGSDRIQIRNGRNNNVALTLDLSNRNLVSTAYGFASVTNLQANYSILPDLNLLRDDADILAQYRGTNAQTYRIYNTYTDASNYERLSIAWSANVMTIGTEAAGTGTQRNLVFSSANQSAYIASPTAAEIRDILISFGFMAAS
jgi:hypothetical protein